MSENKLQSDNVYLRRKIKGVKAQRAELKRQLAKVKAAISGLLVAAEDVAYIELPAEQEQKAWDAAKVLAREACKVKP